MTGSSQTSRLHSGSTGELWTSSSGAPETPWGDLKPLQDLFRQVDELGMKLKDQRSAIAMMLFQDQPL